MLAVSALMQENDLNAGQHRKSESSIGYGREKPVGPNSRPTS
jgi:hypothetical protein